MKSKKAKEDLEKDQKDQVKALVNKAYNQYHRTVPWNDLQSAGSLGLAKAINEFDEARGVPFGGYAFKVVSDNIKACVRDFFGRSQKSPRRVTSYSTAIVDEAEDSSDLGREIEERDERHNKKEALKIIMQKLAGNLDPRELKLLELLCENDMNIPKIAASLNTPPGKMKRMYRDLLSKAKKLLGKKPTKKQVAKKKSTKKSSLESISKEAKRIDEIMEEMDLFSFEHGNKPKDQVLKESLEASERNNPKFKKLLAQLDKKGADRYEIAKILANEDYGLFKRHLELKEDAKKYKNKTPIKPAAIQDIIDAKGSLQRTLTWIYENLPDKHEDYLWHGKKLEEKLKSKGYDLTKISQDNSQMWPVFTKIMVDLYDYLNPLCNYKPKVMRRKIEFDQTFEENKPEYKGETLNYITRLIQLCFKECKNLTPEQVKSRIQKSLTNTPANQNF